MPRLSLVTGTLDRHEDFYGLSRSVIAHTVSDWEMIVSDASAVPVESLDPRIRIVPEQPRLGYTAGYNRAFSRCTGEFVIFLNDDAEVCAGYDTAAIEFMEAHPRIGLGALSYSNLGGPYTVNTYCGMVYANFGIIRRTLGERIGWFDPELKMYGSDNALAFAVLLAGYGIAPIHEARLLHWEVDDTHRRQNQNGRWDAVETLRRKYLPHLDRMLTTYRECKPA